MADNPIWERLPSETDKSFEAFAIYRDMGVNRSLRKLVQRLNKDSTNYLRVLADWSKNHNWQERVSKYDEHQAEQRALRKQKSRIQIEGNVLKDYRAMRKAIDKRLKLLEQTDYRGDLSDFHSLLSLMKNADDYARRSVGLPDKVTEQKHEHTGKDGKDLPASTTTIIIKTGMDLDEI